jgi:predicted transcriptional regulator
MVDFFIPSRSGASSVLGPLEARIMEVIWAESRPVPVGDVHRALCRRGRTISYSAVKAVLNNLTDKKKLHKTREGKVTFFTPTSSREAFEAQVVSTVVRSLKRNFGSTAIAQLVDQLATDEKAVAELERLIAQRKSELKS